VAAVVVALAELVGVLESVGAAAGRAGAVALAEDAIVDAQAAQDLGPAPVRAALGFVDAMLEDVSFMAASAAALAAGVACNWLVVGSWCSP
jgi:hypothetical protein